MLAVARIEISGRFVRQKHFRLIGKGAGDGDALLFAAGKLGRVMMPAIGQIDVDRAIVRRAGFASFKPRISIGIKTFSNAVRLGIK